MAIILLAAELFTNSVEWLGNKLKLGEGAVGSILAAVGTAMPETMIPIIAILFVGGEASHEVGIGAILGAPFMLSTIAFALTGTTALLYARGGRRSRTLMVNAEILQRDLGYFLMIYTMAIAAAFLPVHELKVGLALVLLLLYGLYVWQTLRHESELSGDLPPLYFHRNSASPHLAVVLAQFFFALLLIVLGARVFVANVEEIAHVVGIAPLVLSLLIAPLATELPEKFNSVLWVRSNKDTLALGNLSGAMVFQSCIPVAIGLIFTAWELEPPALVSGILAILSTLIVYGSLRWQRVLHAQVLLLGGLFYLAFVAYVVALL
ncbi:MAG: sodium:calcium antiporter [Chloroflexi bacterium]|nr:sodium:calcium antiporter [Chloroflexota bacterium]